MATQTIGIREFRDNLSSYLFESDAPVEITRHGERIGLYLPTPRRPTKADLDAYHQAHALLQADMAANNVTEEQIFADIEALRAQWKKRD